MRQCSYSYSSRVIRTPISLLHPVLVGWRHLLFECVPNRWLSVVLSVFIFVVQSCLPLFHCCFLFFMIFFLVFLLQVVWCAGLHMNLICFVFLALVLNAVGMHGQITLLYLQCLSLSRSLLPQSSSLCSEALHGHWLRSM